MLKAVSMRAGANGVLVRPSRARSLPPGGPPCDRIGLGLFERSVRHDGSGILGRQQQPPAEVGLSARGIPSCSGDPPGQLKPEWL